jgi:hypothetical protein
MSSSCAAHPAELAHDLCRSCKHNYCEDCLVHVHGPKKPPMCLRCALRAGGVRIRRW